ncbi:hypothetical protein CYMTET_13228 [Cymbomonas tetramitiformis]|uniref:DUF1343 domain-containing protein n=1 Tax=Cymbomonas tetramitiformis TaxID=36881 RepID=A0AAE0GIV0_9CHLO|nr:hypothetical protein CYMTET_13228 [Cymbomonas tetramitiformis]
MPQRPPQNGQQQPVCTGLQNLANEDWKLLRGFKIGLLTNATGVFSDLRHAADAMHMSPYVNLVALFGPEHGFRGVAQAGSSQDSHTDPSTGLPVFDIYRKHGSELLSTFRKADVEILVVDLQDVGCRFYTYIWILYEALVAAAMASSDMRVVVLDRPNPVGGTIVEGPVLRAGYFSGVGLKPIALRHGMTIGELAQLFNGEFVPSEAGKACRLEVVRMSGWHRAMHFVDTQLPWVPPSPNMPTPSTALVYSGLGLFEGTNCSEGRGTTLPFEMIGAPWVDTRLTEAARDAGRRGLCLGAAYREVEFCPSFSKFSGQTVRGVHIYVTDPGRFEAVRAALVLMVAMKRLYRTSFAWRTPDFGSGKYWIDLLSGSSVLREAIDNGADIDEIIALWEDDLVWFETTRTNYLLY